LARSASWVEPQSPAVRSGSWMRTLPQPKVRAIAAAKKKNDRMGASKIATVGATIFCWSVKLSHAALSWRRSRCATRSDPSSKAREGTFNWRKWGPTCTWNWSRPEPGLIPAYWVATRSTSPVALLIAAAPQSVGSPLASNLQPNAPDSFAAHCPAFKPTTYHPEPTGLPALLPLA
jgi:hypothetical protein